ncbi:MAG: hypothetical protein ACTSQJ_13255 [Promethearchaeota archaeon]
MARCPECAGKMTFNSAIKQVVCNSCGLSLSRHELDQYWRKIKSQNIDDLDDLQRKKQRKKEWLDWYAKSKSEKENY